MMLPLLLLFANLVSGLHLLQAQIRTSETARQVSSTGTNSDLNNWKKLAAAENRKLCVIEPNKDGGDDAPAILDALNKDCKSKSLVVFPGSVYRINSTMNTTQLDDVKIHQYGRFLWSPDVHYWLSVSMPVGFQNQSTVWYFGGDNVIWDGFGVGTLDGNGQVWYDWAKSKGNLPHRPMAVNYRHFSNSIVRGVRFVQSQMWTMAIMYSKNLLFEDIYVNSTSTSKYSTLNTDGADTIYSDNITFSRWTVQNGDDGIALKGNSSNIFVYDSVFYDGQGIAIGSLGQFEGQFEYIDNFYARNLTMHNTNYACYLKTWAGIRNGYPPNGGGGGKGYGRNIVLEDVVMDRSRGPVFFIHQCENYEGHSGEDCDSSKFKFEDVVWRGLSGVTKSQNEYGGWLKCSSGSGGCSNITVEDFTVRSEGQDEVLKKWHCKNVESHSGFECGNFEDEDDGPPTMLSK